MGCRSRHTGSACCMMPSKRSPERGRVKWEKARRSWSWLGYHGWRSVQTAAGTVSASTKEIPLPGSYTWPNLPWVAWQRNPNHEWVQPLSNLLAIYRLRNMDVEILCLCFKGRSGILNFQDKDILLEVVMLLSLYWRFMRLEIEIQCLWSVYSFVLFVHFIVSYISNCFSFYLLKQAVSQLLLSGVYQR